MSVSLSALFTNKLKYLVKASRNLNGYRGTTAPDPNTGQWGVGGPIIYDLDTAVENILTGYNATAFEYVTDGIWADRDAHRAAQKTFMSRLQAYAQATVIAMVDADTTLPAPTLANALAELIRQMKGSTDSVNASAPAVTAATDAGNTGDAISGATVKDVYGKNAEHVSPETLVALATSDSGLGATLSAEPWTVKGEAIETDRLAYTWPVGSGASKALTAVDAKDDTVNYLANGAFNTFTVANTPDDWTVQAGTPGTDILDGTTGAYQGSHCLKFTGQGSPVLSQIWQAVDLEPNTVYALCYRIKDSGAGLLAGVVSFDLYNGSSVVTDDAGTSNSTTKAFGTTTGSYVGYVAFFITPKVLPSTLRLRIHVSTALTSGESMFIDHVALVPATQLYTGGPFAAIFSGATATVKNDRFTFAVTNTQGVFQEWFDRWFDMKKLGLQLPSDAGGSETIVDPT